LFQYNVFINYPEDPVFQYPHLIETITWIYLVLIWLYSLFDSSQNVSHIYGVSNQVQWMHAPNISLLQSWSIHIAKYFVIWSYFNKMYSYSCSEKNTQPILISVANEISHVQQHYETWSVFNILIIWLTFYDLQYMYIYSLCCLRTKVFNHSWFDW
jgi:hypothetical protein